MSTTSARMGRYVDAERPVGEPTGAGTSAPSYWVETFTDAEREVLARYVTNVDGPVFALRNLPEAVKAALFARYSRTGKSLRRLFLDEFADRAEEGEFEGPIGERRAVELYARVFDEYGDDSVAQLGGAHLACEQASNVLTKLLEWGRLAAYLEQSTRYVSYAERRDGRYRYHIDPAVDASPLGPEYRRVLDRLFTTYAEGLPVLSDHVGKVMPHAFGTSEPAWRRAVKARALDGLRGLLPAATTSNLGIFASGQAFEGLLLRLRANPLPEARTYADMMLAELRQVIPTFLTRVDRPNRGGVWSSYLAETAGDAASVVAELIDGAGGVDAPDDAPAPPPAWADPAGAQLPGASVRLVSSDPAAEDKVLAAIAYEHGRLDAAGAARRVARLGADDRARLLAAYVGDRTNRRHKPGRAFEQAVYTFDVVTDYGAFRDLQRHRLCTIVWQPLSPGLGYDVPPDVEAAGLGNRFASAMADSAALYEALLPEFPAQAPYAVSLAHRVRFLMTINARALMHFTELRSDAQGHPAYRAVAQRMHRLVAEQAGHRALASAMRFVVHDQPDAEDKLGRLAAERRLEQRRAGHEARAPQPPPEPDERPVSIVGWDRPEEAPNPAAGEPRPLTAGQDSPERPAEPADEVGASGRADAAAQPVGTDSDGTGGTDGGADADGADRAAGDEADGADGAVLEQAHPDDGPGSEQRHADQAEGADEDGAGHAG